MSTRPGRTKPPAKSARSPRASTVCAATLAIVPSRTTIEAFGSRPMVGCTTVMPVSWKSPAATGSGPVGGRRADTAHSASSARVPTIAMAKRMHGSGGNWLDGADVRSRWRCRPMRLSACIAVPANSLATTFIESNTPAPFGDRVAAGGEGGEVPSMLGSGDVAASPASHPCMSSIHQRTFRRANPVLKYSTRSLDEPNSSSVEYASVW